MDFLVGLLTRGLALQSNVTPSIVDQFVRDNVGNYVIQSILKRLHREMLCITSFLTSTNIFTTHTSESDMCSSLELVLYYYFDYLIFFLINFS